MQSNHDRRHEATFDTVMRGLAGTPIDVADIYQAPNKLAQIAAMNGKPP